MHSVAGMRSTVTLRELKLAQCKGFVKSFATTSTRGRLAALPLEDFKIDGSRALAAVIMSQGPEPDRDRNLVAR